MRGIKHIALQVSKTKLAFFPAYSHSQHAYVEKKHLHWGSQCLVAATVVGKVVEQQT